MLGARLLASSHYSRCFLRELDAILRCFDDFVADRRSTGVILDRTHLVVMTGGVDADLFEALELNTVALNVLAPLDSFGHDSS
jgi:hypothetical protein